ncbi:hypothetical protein ACFPK1_00085 [Actinomycetospora rhizophila]|uniref:Secreted protein n=1 Tax=Actinomycetospora rhizophila TaxID=1416876 RepID=A0ABV9Z636_9PSEU
MGTVAVVIIVVVVLLVLAGIAALVLARRRRQQQLEQEFGPEYERRVQETGDRKEAEKELRQRKERHDQHQLRPLQSDERQRFHADWQQVQRGFVDDPGGAVEHADALLVTIMRARGYPVEGGERRTDDLSVAQPHLVEDYREAQRVVTAHRQGTATTEDLRGAFTAFRTLVEAMLDDGGDGRGDGGADGRRDRHGDGRAPDGATERIAGGDDGRFGHPNAGTERMQGAPGQGVPPGGAPPQGAPPRGAPRQGVPHQGAPQQGAPQGAPQGVPPQGPPPGGPAGPGRPPSAPPASGGPDGHQERRR